jgi:cell division septum initiation protein DivIVA
MCCAIIDAYKQIIDLQRMNKELTEEAFRLRKQLGNSNNNASSSSHSGTAAAAAAAATGGHHTSHSSGALSRKGSAAANANATTTATATSGHGCVAAGEDEHVNNENATK